MPLITLGRFLYRVVNSPGAQPSVHTEIYGSLLDLMRAINNNFKRGIYVTYTILGTIGCNALKKWLTVVAQKK